MILDIFISVVLLIFILFPRLLKSMNTSVGKLLFLVFIFLIIKQNDILGLVAAGIFMFHIIKPIESFSPKHKGKPSLLPMDETIRPKDSNLMSVKRNSVAPPGEEISGSIDGPVANNIVGSYSQINI
jgi:hypothetical protein